MLERKQIDAKYIIENKDNFKKINNLFNIAKMNDDGQLSDALHSSGFDMLDQTIFSEVFEDKSDFFLLMDYLEEKVTDKQTFLILLTLIPELKKEELIKVLAEQKGLTIPETCREQILQLFDLIHQKSFEENPSRSDLVIQKSLVKDALLLTLKKYQQHLAEKHHLQLFSLNSQFKERLNRRTDDKKSMDDTLLLQKFKKLAPVLDSKYHFAFSKDFDDKEFKKTKLYDEILIDDYREYGLWDIAPMTDIPGFKHADTKYSDKENLHTKFHSIFIRTQYDLLHFRFDCRTEFSGDIDVHTSHGFRIKQSKLYTILLTDSRFAGLELKKHLLTQMMQLGRYVDSSRIITSPKLQMNAPGPYAFAIMKINDLKIEQHDKELLQLILLERWLEQEISYRINFIEESFSERYDLMKLPNPVIILAALHNPFLMKHLINNLITLIAAKEEESHTAIFNFVKKVLEKIILVPRRIPITTVSKVDDIIFDYASFHYKEHIESAKKVYTQLMLTKTDDKAEVTFLEWLFKHYYKTPSYQPNHPFNQLLKKLSLPTIKILMDNATDPALLLYISAYLKAEEISLNYKVIDSCKNLTDVINLISRGNLLFKIAKTNCYPEYAYLLEKIIKTALPDADIKLNVTHAKFSFSNLSLKENSQGILLNNFFATLFTHFNSENILVFLKKCDFKKMDPAVFVTILRTLKNMDARIRVSFLKELLSQEHMTYILYHKLRTECGLTPKKIQDLLSLSFPYHPEDTQKNLFIKELNAYIARTTTHSLRAIQACQAKWIIAYSNDYAEMKVKLTKLIKAIQSDSYTTTERLRFLTIRREEDGLAKILLSALTTISEDATIHLKRSSYK